MLSLEQGALHWRVRITHRCATACGVKEFHFYNLQLWQAFSAAAKLSFNRRKNLAAYPDHSSRRKSYQYHFGKVPSFDWKTGNWRPNKALAVHSQLLIQFLKLLPALVLIPNNLLRLYQLALQTLPAALAMAKPDNHHNETPLMRQPRYLIEQKEKARIYFSPHANRFFGCSGISATWPIMRPSESYVPVGVGGALSWVV